MSTLYVGEGEVLYLLATPPQYKTEKSCLPYIINNPSEQALTEQSRKSALEDGGCEFLG